MAYNPFRAFDGHWRPRSIGESLKDFVKSPSWLNRLIVINVGVFVGMWLFRLVAGVVEFLFQFSPNTVYHRFCELVSCPADPAALLHQPWGVVTSLFVHAGFWHLFFNMLMLYVIGRIFLKYVNERHLLAVYLLGGVFGNIVYMAAYNLFPAFSGVVGTSYAVGASGSIMAIMSAITTYRPKHQVNLLILNPISLATLTICFIIIDIISIPDGNAGGHIAHIGGFLFGLIYILLMKRTIDGDKSSETAGRRAKKDKYYVSRESGRPVSDEEYNAKKHQDNVRIDEILDKISKYGYSALTAEEKDFLFHYSRK